MGIAPTGWFCKKNGKWRGERVVGYADPPPHAFWVKGRLYRSPPPFLVAFFLQNYPLLGNPPFSGHFLQNHCDFVKKRPAKKGRASGG